MDNRKFQSGAAASPPTPPITPSNGFPTSGSPTVPPTVPGPYWYHMIAEEIRAVIEGAGLVPDANNLTQLLTAIKRGFGQSWTNVAGPGRSIGTTYTNTTGAPIHVSVSGLNTVANTAVIGFINGSIVVSGGPTPSPSTGTGIYFVVPPGNTYSVSANAGVFNYSSWWELR